MKIALIGTGRMGNAIAELAIRQGMEIALRVDEQNRAGLKAADLRVADVAIEFTRPEAAVDNLMLCLEAGIPVVCGTTGWQDRYQEVADSFRMKGGSLLYASNFSVGVNLLFELNRQLARWMAQFPEYRVSITEVHHIHKLDKPSGTAVSLVQDILERHKDYQDWHLPDGKSSPTNSIAIDAQRRDEVVGTHEVKWESGLDEISIRHHAHNRTGFAQGVLLAAQWLPGKKGVYSMKDILFPSASDTNR